MEGDVVPNHSWPRDLQSPPDDANAFADVLDASVMRVLDNLAPFRTRTVRVGKRSASLGCRQVQLLPSVNDDVSSDAGKGRVLRVTDWRIGLHVAKPTLKSIG